jgi:two-component system cell cycle sensor histidine kinase/response regulator CckA
MSQQRILIVEDERIVALDLQDRLESLGYSIPATVARGQDAIQTALELRPDLVLMDIRLKGEMDGIETAGRIQSHLDVPVIYLTAYADHDTLDRAKLTGPYGYILKPFEDRELQTTIEMALYRHTTDAKLRAHAAELERLKSAIEQVPDAIVITDAKGNIEYINPAFEQMTGYNATEAVGQHAVALNHSEPDDSAEGQRSAICTGHPWQGRLTNRRKDGTTYISEGSIAPMRDESGRITSYVSVQRDVTRELELEEQHREALKMEAVGRLAAGIAHDFNNMLTAINGYASLLLSGMSKQDPDRRMVQAILGAGERATDLIRQLLTFARKDMVDPEVLNLNDLVAGIADMLHRTVGEHIELHTELCLDLWAVKVARTQIDRIIINLAVNARDAMPDGGVIVLSTANVVLSPGDRALGPEGTPGEYVKLSVSDSGIGMSEEVQAHLFEPFFTTKELGRGTGLGLATVYGIVKQNGGNLYVRSEEGQGATFEIYLPRSHEALPRRALPKPKVQSGRGSETILLVEDDESVRELTGAALESQGYQVLMAADASAAHRMAQEHPGPIDLLLTDVIMPGTSGPKLAQQLAGQSPQLKVLYMSGYPDDEIQRHAVDQLLVDMLPKPFQMTDLTSKVRSLLAG